MTTILKEIMAGDFTCYHNDIINGISELVKIPTIYDAATVTETMPYGRNVYDGYLFLKEMALKDGFEVLEYDGHALAIRIKGKVTMDRIDIVSHVDVVEPGDGWRESPFSGTITKEHVYGRGTQDMKGPLMLTYYALKLIKDYNIPCKKEIRIVIGCDEERTMEDIKYYITKAGEPAFAFTPDGKFPFSFGEKGALMWCIDGKIDSCIEELDGGVQCNVVSPKAVALVNDIERYEKYKELIVEYGNQSEVVKQSNKLIITIHGKAAHASRPQEGINATVKLLELINRVSQDSLAELLYDCFYDYYGEGGNINYDIEPMGKLTVNLGLLKISDKIVTAYIDCRYPYGITSNILTEKIQKVLEPLEVTLKYDDKPTLADANSPYIKVLLDTYREVSKDTISEPIISGGVTYSKAIANCVAFGPMLQGDEVLAHQANEVFNIKNIDQLFELYAKTIIQLGNL